MYMQGWLWHPVVGIVRSSTRLSELPYRPTETHTRSLHMRPKGRTVSFQNFMFVFCGLDSGNLKFETVRTHKQHICF